jgi:flavin reductase (DIM6/NTAB) family NADH-FMN oxidoreductase RutF
MTFRHLDPDELSEAERHRILIGAITPRPIAFVSTRSPEGHDNLAPYSFYTAIGSTPMTLLFCPGYRSDGTPKDSLLNSRPKEDGGLGEFVVNVAVEAYAREVGAASSSLARAESEFELTGLTPEPSRVVAPPRLKEAPISFECVTLRSFQVEPSAPHSSWLVIGKVVHVWLRDDLADEAGRIDADALGTIGRMAGREYALTRERFALPRGLAALDQALPFEPRKRNR